MPQSAIGICSWSLRPQSPQHLITLLQNLQIDAVQLDLTWMNEHPRLWYPAVQALPEAGIRILSGMVAMKDEDYATLQSIAASGGVRPDDTWPANVARIESAITLAVQMQLDLVTFHAGFIPELPDDPERGTMIDRIRQVVDAFAAEGIRVGLETGQETADTLLAALDEINRPMLGVNFDPANMILYGKGDPIESLRKLAPHVVQLHIKDALPTDTPGTWGTEVPVGQGAVDWNAFFAVAGTIDPPVNCIIEREAGEDRLDDIRAARDLIERIRA